MKPARQLPVFVYGTLRRGQRNHGTMQDLLASVRPAALPGHVLYCDRSMPYIVPGDGTVQGDLVTARHGQYAELLARLDALEGYWPGPAEEPRNHYNRRAVTVTAGGRATEAWAYIAGQHAQAMLLPEDIVPDGDYVRHLMRDRRTQRRRTRRWDRRSVAARVAVLTAR